MSRIRPTAIVFVLALAATFGVAFVAGCGGGGSDVDPQTVLDDTFNNDTRVTSGDLTLSVSGSAEGDAGGSFEAKLEGPFQTDPDNAAALPQLDWTGSISGSGAGQSLSAEGGLVITDDNAFVEYGGNTYEVGTDTFSQFKQLAESAAQQQSDTEGLSFADAFKQGCEQSLEAQGASDTSACEIDFEGWLSDLSSEDGEDIEGQDSDHISGSLDVNAMLTDLIALGGAVPQASAAGLPSEDQVQQLADAVSDASFDLYSTSDDHLLDGLDFNLDIDPSAIPGASESGVSSVGVDFSLRLGAINEEQDISAPSDAQPIDGLLQQLGVDPSALGGLGDLGSLGGGAALPGGSGGAGGSGGSGNTDAYFKCLDQATTAEEINKCSAQL